MWLIPILKPSSLNAHAYPFIKKGEKSISPRSHAPREEYVKARTACKRNNFKVLYERRKEKDKGK
jgi:hypothetical protein